MRRRGPAVFCAALAMTAPPLMAAESPATTYDIIGSAIRHGRLIQAHAMLERLPANTDASDPTERVALNAELTLAEGQAQTAYEDFVALDAQQSGNCRYRRGLGLSAARLGKWDETRTVLGGYAPACPPMASVWNALAVAAAHQHDWAASRAASEAALALAPNDPAILNNMAMALFDQQKPAEAAEVLERAAALAPADQRIANNLDMTRGAMGVDPVRHATGDDPHRWAERLTAAGQGAMMAGKADQARRLFSQAVVADPLYAAAADVALAKISDKP